jgi:LysM repeat protein
MIVDQLYTRTPLPGTERLLFTESRHRTLLSEDQTYRKFHALSNMLAERRMSEKEILDLFAAIEQGANATGQNRTALGKGKDAVAGAYNSAKDAISGVLNSIQMSTPVAGVDAAYNDATGALRDAVGGNSKVMDSIKKYRLLAKEYPKTQLFVKTALIALAGMATGGAGLPAIAGLTAAVDAAIKGEKLSSLIGKGAGAALMGLGAQKLQAALAGGTVPADQTLSPGEEISLPDKYPDTVTDVGPTTDYVVKKGDTLSDIAKANKVSVDDLMKANAGQTIVKPDGQSITWNDANALSDVNAMGDYVGPGTGVQQDYSVSTSPKIANPDVLAVGQHIKIPAPTGATPYAGNVGLAGDTWNKIGSGAYPYSQISANQAAKYGLKENVTLKTLPANQLIDQKLTVLAWALVESAGKSPARNIHLTHQGVVTVFENVDRHRRALLKELNAVGPSRADIPAVPRPDMPGVAAQPGAVQPGAIGRGLNWLDKQAGKVGNYFTKQAQNFTRKVTAAKLKTEWEQLGHFTDSDEIAAFLAKQGVPQGVISDVYGKMGIPISAQPAAQTQPTAKTGGAATSLPYYGINPATKKAWTVDELQAKAAAGQTTAPAPAPVATTAPGKTNITANPAGFNATNVMQMPGMEKYAKKPEPAKTTNFAGPSGYGKTTMSFKAPNAPAAPAAPKAPTVTSGGATAAERAALEKKIAAAAAAQPVAETVKRVNKMLESVKTTKDVDQIKKYIDQQFVAVGLTESALAQRKKLMDHVTRVSSIRRRMYASQLIK